MYGNRLIAGQASNKVHFIYYLFIKFVLLTLNFDGKEVYAKQFKDFKMKEDYLY